MTTMGSIFMFIPEHQEVYKQGCAQFKRRPGTFGYKVLEVLGGFVSANLPRTRIAMEAGFYKGSSVVAIGCFQSVHRAPSRGSGGVAAAPHKK